MSRVYSIPIYNLPGEVGVLRRLFLIQGLEQGMVEVIGVAGVEDESTFRTRGSVRAQDLLAQIQGFPHARESPSWWLA